MFTKQQLEILEICINYIYENAGLEGVADYLDLFEDVLPITTEDLVEQIEEFGPNDNVDIRKLHLDIMEDKANDILQNIIGVIRYLKSHDGISRHGISSKVIAPDDPEIK